MGAFWVLRQAEGRRKTCDATSYNSGVVGAGMQKDYRREDEETT